MTLPGTAERGLSAWLERRLGEAGVGAYSGLCCLVVLVVAGLAALLARQPLLFPSLGPTAILFFERPVQRAACPRNTLAGHAVAVVVGYGCLAAFGLLHAGPVTRSGVDAARLGAAAVSVAATALVQRAAHVPHPPAGATTLIVSLGILPTPHDLAMIMAGVALLTVAGVALNRLLGVRAPLWAP